jgi:hypothetical protein
VEKNVKYRSSRLKEDPSIAESAFPNTGAPGFNLFTFFRESSFKQRTLIE